MGFAVEQIEQTRPFLMYETMSILPILYYLHLLFGHRSVVVVLYLMLYMIFYDDVFTQLHGFGSAGIPLLYDYSGAFGKHPLWALFGANHQPLALGCEYEVVAYLVLGIC